MKSVSVFGIVLAAWLFALAGPGTNAGEKKEKPKLPPDTLTDESLKEKLDDLGYDFKVIKSTTGTPMYLLDFTRDNFRYVFYVSLASDKTRLWMSCALRKLPETKIVPTDILEKILTKNDDIGPTHFTLRKNRFLYLELGLDNYGLTPRRLRKEIDGFAGNIRSTQDLWDPTRWPKTVKPKTDQ
jgi:hypothetical protein